MAISAKSHLRGRPTNQWARNTMLTLLNQLFSPAKRAAAVPNRQGVASSLLERAEACAGQDPRRAAELRQAAIAFLGVVR